jgi:hypothetical protein
MIITVVFQGLVCSLAISKLHQEVEHIILYLYINMIQSRRMMSRRRVSSKDMSLPYGCSLRRSSFLWVCRSQPSHTGTTSQISRRIYDI